MRPVFRGFGLFRLVRAVNSVTAESDFSYELEIHSKMGHHHFQTLKIHQVDQLVGKKCRARMEENRWFKSSGCHTYPISEEQYAEELQTWSNNETVE